MHFEFFDTMRKNDHLSLIFALYFFGAGDFRLQAVAGSLHGEETTTKPFTIEAEPCGQCSIESLTLL